MPEIDDQLSDETAVPLKWLLALLAGCATFTGGAVFTGMYFGGRDANASALTQRVDRLEEAVKQIPQIAQGVARLEGAMGTLPSEERLPASHRRYDGP